MKLNTFICLKNFSQPLKMWSREKQLEYNCVFSEKKYSYVSLSTMFGKRLLVWLADLEFQQLPGTKIKMIFGIPMSSGFNKQKVV